MSFHQSNSDETREIRQFHFLSWPDFGVPRHATPLLYFLRRIRTSHPYSSNKPLAIHCRWVGQVVIWATSITDFTQLHVYHISSPELYTSLSSCYNNPQNTSFQCYSLIPHYLGFSSECRVHTLWDPLEVHCITGAVPVCS